MGKWRGKAVLKAGGTAQPKKNSLDLSTQLFLYFFPYELLDVIKVLAVSYPTKGVLFSNGQNKAKLLLSNKNTLERNV